MSLDDELARAIRDRDALRAQLDSVDLRIAAMRQAKAQARVAEPTTERIALDRPGAEREEPRS